MFERSGQKLASLAFFSVLFIGVVNATAAYTIMGNVDSYEKDGYNITFNCENGIFAFEIGFDWVCFAQNSS